MDRPGRPFLVRLFGGLKMAEARPSSGWLLEQVRDRVLAGHVAPGLPIRQDILASHLGVSKIPVREALAKLEQDGLVRSHANRGFFVRLLSSYEAEEIYALRLKLEPELVALAARRATPQEKAAALDALDLLEQAIEECGSAVGRLNRAFHLALIRPARQELTAGIIEKLHVLSERYVRMHLEPHGHGTRANEEHRHLLRRWTAGDGSAAASLMEEHIGQTLRDLRHQFAEAESQAAACPRGGFEEGE